jgi:porin
VLCNAAHCLAWDITDQLSLGGVVAGAYQYQEVGNAQGFEDKGRGAGKLEPEISFTPTKNDQLMARLGFAQGNALNGDNSPYTLDPWGAVLEDGVKNINGRSRDHLLTVWYKHTFRLTDDYNLGITGGIIDATDYLDDNRYANDEYTQFMNTALVNAPDFFVPSYDYGGALEFEFGNSSLQGVVMSVGENDDGNAYTFYAIELGYAAAWSPGKGNYRVLAGITSNDYWNTAGTQKEARRAMILSFDQELGELLGAWVRMGWQNDKPAVNSRYLYSGGVDISGDLWGRKHDNAGIGFACFGGGNKDLDNTRVVEGYVRFVFKKVFALTLDIQHMRDTYKIGTGPKGLICGVRVTAEF